MATNIYSGRIMVHPTEVVEVSGKVVSSNGSVREINIYLSTAAVEELRKTFEFQAAHCKHLGHAHWHVVNGQPPCPQCKD